VVDVKEGGGIEHTFRVLKEVGDVVDGQGVERGCMWHGTCVPHYVEGRGGAGLQEGGHGVYPPPHLVIPCLVVWACTDRLCSSSLSLLPLHLLSIPPFFSGDMTVKKAARGDEMGRVSVLE